MPRIWLPSDMKFFAVLGLVLSLGACQAGSSPEDAHALVQKGAVLLDVRSPDEFAAGHLEGAINVPVDRLESSLKEVGAPDRPMVVYCHSGRRSRWASEILQKNGFKKVHDLGPMSRW